MMFTSFVKVIGPTKFFARRVEDRQFLACEFSYASDGMTALVIPIPVSNTNRDRSVKVINLSTYRNFFDHLSRVFPRENTTKQKAQPILQYVNHIEPITYWSTLTEFNEKVDPRFKLAQEFWNQLSYYQDWGFVSVILPDTADNFNRTFPFAFEFKTRLPDGMFIPTLELSNCHLNASTVFHHELYYQGKRRQLSDCPSTHLLEESIDYTRSRPLLVEGPGFKRSLTGKFPNGDVVI
jgi:hypothetical protein